MTSSKKKRALTGIRATGIPHIGNYFGAIRPAVQLQESFECLYFIADLHSLTTTKDGKLLREQCYDVTAGWIACGLDVSSHLLYRQSDLPMVAEFAWYLSCVTGMGFLEKGHAYKDAREQNQDVNHGILAYPVLMAADIIMYDADVVPVGKDQKQHVEMARDMAGSFNAAFGKQILKLPEVRIEEQFMIIPGLDGRKMSKSYNNYVPLFCSEKELKKLIMGMKTDSTPVEAPKSLKGGILEHYFPLFATPTQIADLESRLQRGGMGWGHAKDELFQLMNIALTPLREKFSAIRPDTNYLDRVLKDGAQRAFAICEPVLNRARAVAGMQPFPYRLVG